MSGVSRFDWRTIAVVVVVAVAVLIGMIAISDGSADQDPPPDPTTGPAMVQLDFAVWGNDAEIAAFQAVVDDYNASSKDTNVSLSSWPDAGAMLEDIRSGEAHPDLYLLPRSELAGTIAAKRNRPLLDLLEEREIPIGDDFSREAVAAFSVDDDLQCMPYTTSPMVIYYNTELVDFGKMEEEGLPTPNPDHTGWTLAEFRAAAEYASRPRQGTRGVHIEPTLDGLAPFILSGGGRLFDDESAPTSLALSEDGSADALRQTLEVLRDPRLTLSSKQLQRRPALDWFKRGRVAMIAGFRELTPELRKTKGLHFDVMPMPSLGSSHTIGEVNGICLTAGKPQRVRSSADFLTYLVSEEAVARVTQTGYLQPSNLKVALSSAFLQPDEAPEHSMVFNNAVRTVVQSPVMEEGAELEELVAPDLEALLTAPVVGDLTDLLAAIDDKSRTLLDPDYVPEESDAGSGGPTSGASSDDPSGSGPPPSDPSPSDSVTDDRKRD